MPLLLRTQPFVAGKYMRWCVGSQRMITYFIIMHHWDVQVGVVSSRDIGLHFPEYYSFSTNRVTLLEVSYFYIALATITTGGNGESRSTSKGFLSKAIPPTRKYVKGFRRLLCRHAYIISTQWETICGIYDNLMTLFGIKISNMTFTGYMYIYIY